MTPIEFPEQTIIIAKDQPEYIPLPAYQFLDPQGTVCFCWQLTWRERIRLLVSGRLWHSVLTFYQPLQPQMLSIDSPITNVIKNASNP